MKTFKEITDKLRHESSFIFALLLVAGVIVLLRDPQSIVGTGLVISAIFVGILGFIINSIRENYEGVITQKDEMIKTLTKERKSEIKHFEDYRRSYENRASGGWEASSPDIEDA